MNKQNIAPRTILAIVVTLLVWSSAFAGIRAGLDGYTPVHLALLRFIVASLALAIYALITRMRLPERRDLPAILLVGFFGVTVYHVALNLGEQRVSAGVASLLINSEPVFVALLAVLFLGERLRLLAWVGVVVSFAGIVLIALGQGGDFRFEPAVLLVVLSALAASVAFVYQKPYLRRYTALEFTAYSIWAGTLLMLIFAPGLPQALAAAPLGATLAVVYLGLFPAAIGYVTWAYCLSKMPAAHASSFLNLVPLLSTLVAFLWRGEVPAVLALGGGAIAIIGVILVNSQPSDHL